MTTLTTRPTRLRPPRARRPAPRALAQATAETPDGGRVTLYDIPWDGYVAFLDAVGERPIRVNYDDGVMEIMTISSEHETAKKRIGGLLEDLAIELGIEIAPRGSMTFRSKRIRKGLEPDECYYVANERKIRARKQIDLRRDPPPDLVIEIDVSYHEVDRESMYAEVGVPELWRYDGKQLWFFRLVAGGWVGVDGSVSFPGRPAGGPVAVPPHGPAARRDGDAEGVPRMGPRRVSGRQTGRRRVSAGCHTAGQQSRGERASRGRATRVSGGGALLQSSQARSP